VKQWIRYLVIVLTAIISFDRACAQEAAPNETATEVALRQEDNVGQAGGTRSPHGRQLWGYVFVAPGFAGVPDSPERMLHWGGGVEWRFHKAIGIGAEAGALHLGSAAAYPLFMMSVNGSYHFRERQTGRTLVPFVTAGYTGASMVSGLDMPWFNCGVGTNYWFHNKTGARLELRYQATDRGTGCFAEGDCRNWSLEARVGFNFGRSVSSFP
jgi:hypothetical protein